MLGSQYNAMLSYVVAASHCGQVDHQFALEFNKISNTFFP